MIFDSLNPEARVRTEGNPFSCSFLLAGETTVSFPSLTFFHKANATGSVLSLLGSIPFPYLEEVVSAPVKRQKEVFLLEKKTSFKKILCS